MFATQRPMGSRRLRNKCAAVDVERLEGRIFLSSDVLTYHNDNSRTGADLNESILTPQNVNATDFGQLFSYPLDGAAYAQPLYVSNLAIPGKGTHDVVFVATEHDSVYAFDADNNSGANAQPLWHDSFIDPAAGITAVPAQDTQADNIAPEVGITGTPVIDAATGTFYVVSNTKDTNPATGAVTYQQQLHALDITTGAEKFGGPVVIQFSTPGTGAGSAAGSIAFNALIELQRSALALANGAVYITWASHADMGPYHGFIAAYDASNLQLESVLNVTPDGAEGGIWAGGDAPAIDSQGNLFLSVGNGTFDNGNNDWGDSMLKITDTAGLAVADSFTPFNQEDMQNYDVDFGSGGVVLLPTQDGADPDEAISGGKDSNLYLVDRDDLGGYNATTNDNLQTINTGGAILSTPAYFNGTLYDTPADKGLLSFPVVDGQLAAPTASSPETYGTLGSTPSISANGSQDGIVWDVAYGTNAVLHAYDASDVANELYSSSQAGTRDQLPRATQFAVPTIADGQVFVGTATTLAVFGLLATARNVPPALPSNLTATALSATAIDLTWQQNSTNAASFMIERSTDGVNFTQIGLVAGTSTNYDDITAQVGMTYTYVVEAQNSAGMSGLSSSATASTQAIAGLVGYWQFDEGTGTIAADATASASADDGTLVGDVIWSQGRIGPADVDFAGTGAQTTGVDIPDEPQLQFSTAGSFTIGVWVQASTLAGKWTGIVTKGNDAASGYGLYLDPANHWVFATSAGNNVIEGPLADTGWHYLTVSQDGSAGTRQLYVDGVLAASGIAEDASGAGDLWVGGSSSIAGQYFNGAVDDLRVYDVALTAAQIQALSKVPASAVSGSGVISGIVFQDDNQSGAQDTGEAGAGGVLVFLDNAGTGILEPNEPTVITDASGNYSFSGLADGTYHVIALPTNEEHLTTPSAGFTDVTISGGQTVTGINFGEADNKDAAVPSQFKLALTSKLPKTAINGQQGTAVLRVTNTSGLLFNAPLQLALFISTSQVLDNTAYSVADPSYQKVKLHPGQDRTFDIRFTYSTDIPAGSYYLIASVTAERSEGEDQFIVRSSTQVAVAPPAVTLRSAISNPQGIPIKVGKDATAVVRVSNDGNVAALGTVTLSLFASIDTTLDDSDAQMSNVTKTIRISAGGFRTYRVRFTAPAQFPQGAYYVIAQVDSNTTPPDSNATTDIAVAVATTRVS